MLTNKPTVLFVDDEKALLNALRRAFRDAPFVLLFAESGEQALAVAAEHTVHVVVADMQMPGMGGLELHRQLQARFPDIVRILLSGYPNPDPEDVSAMVQALHRGDIFRFVAKGSNMLADVQEAVESALQQCQIQSGDPSVISD